MADRVAPILPSRDLDRTAAFYGRLGFDVGVRIDPPENPYMILYIGDLWLHFFAHEGDPARSDAMCYLHLDDPDAWAARLRALELPATGIPRFEDVEDKPWGMREFALVDPDGTLLRGGRDVTELPRG